MRPWRPRHKAVCFCRAFLPGCFLTICLLLAACGGAQTASPPPAAGATGDTISDPVPPQAAEFGSPSELSPATPAAARPTPTLSPNRGAPASSDSASVSAPGGHTQAAPPGPAAGIAPVWQPLARRLAADGLAGPEVDRLLATLGNTPSQSPMGRKMRELYLRRFFPRPPSGKPAPLYYKGVVTERNARLCREFIAANAQAFARAGARYGVPPAIAASLLFVETRLGKVLADVPENAFYTLASMAVSREPQSISQWLPRMPGYEQHLDWFAATMPRRADWAYKEVRALLQHLLREKADPRTLPGSIYGAVGLCQFMPSNIAVYGADGDGDGKVDLFSVPDAVASLANYLARHGWKPGLARDRQHKILMAYNHSQTYANTILALSDLVTRAPESPSAKSR